MPKITPVDNVSIFNAVRAFMSPSFQDRIPQATIDNIESIGNMITSQEFEVEFNQWQSALVNKIGMTIFHQYDIQNPLEKYVFGEMSFGDAIEEIATDIVKGRAMDYGKEGESLDPFVKVSPTAKAEYHRVNEPIQYMNTLEKDRLRRAFHSGGNVSRLLNMFISELYSSANIDSWLLMKNIMSYYIHDQKAAAGMPLLSTQKITSVDVIDKTTAEDFLLQIMNTMSAMRYPNNAFNPQKIHKTLNKRDLVLFMRSDIVNTIGVRALAQAFNKEDLNLNVRVEEMDDFGDDTDDVMAMLTEDWWFLVTRQLEDMESIYNPRSRGWNYFLTRQMSFGCSYFKDAAIFKKSWD